MVDGLVARVASGRGRTTARSRLLALRHGLMRGVCFYRLVWVIETTTSTRSSMLGRRYIPLLLALAVWRVWRVINLRTGRTFETIALVVSRTLNGILRHFDNLASLALFAICSL